MSAKRATIDFVISGVAPQTLPLGRAAEYLADLAQLFGTQNTVYLKGVVKGSAVLQTLAGSEDAYAKAIGRAQSAPNGPEDVARIYRQLDTRLRANGCSAFLRDRGGRNVLVFPGVKLPGGAAPVTIKQLSQVDGVVIRVGGQGETIPVHIRDSEGVVYTCHVRRRDRARDLAKYLFESPIRVSGQGTWTRTEDAVWKLEALDIQSWEALDGTPLVEVVASLRALSGNGWSTLADPISFARRLRGE